MKLFELADYREVIAAADATGLEVVLVGGHAVSYYAERYLPLCPALRAFFPLLSKDADLIGSVEDGLRLARALNARWEQNPRKGGMQGLALGRFTLPGQPEAQVEILGRILGASAEEVRASAYRVETPEGDRMRVINPFLLYVVKGNNLVQIAQREPGRERQDGRQFAVMALVVGAMLQEFASARSPEAVRALVKTCGRLLEFWLSPDGAALVRGGAAHPRETLPTAAMLGHASESVRNVVERRLPGFFDQQLPAAVARVSERVAAKVRADVQRVVITAGQTTLAGMPLTPPDHAKRSGQPTMGQTPTDPETPKPEARHE